MITSQGLEKLGFKSLEDFVLEQVNPTTIEIIEWYSDQPQPSESAIVTAHNAWQTEYDSQEYARNRKIEYDALNQLELISDDAANSTTTHIDAIAAIKTKWPKDNSGPVE
tara:strand:- start:84 stop:413 length:330 start_codon:yes stop_codon:yes gene_type:complete